MPIEAQFKETKVDRELFGVFTEPGSVAAGDPFNKQLDKTGRHFGKQFGVPHQPAGTGPDAWIDKGLKLTLPGDKYVEPSRIEKDLASRGGKPLTGKPFHPASPAPRPTGPGSLYGVFGPSTSLLDTDPGGGAAGGRRPGAPPDPNSLAGKKNIYVSPPKKGTFGYPWQDRTIGQTKMAFVADEFERGRVLEREEKAKLRAKFAKPFVSTGRTGKGITPITYATTPGEDRKGEKDPAPAKPWKYSNPPAKGQGYGTINRLVYVPQPTRELAKTDPGPNAGKGFKPPGVGHTRLSMWSPNPYRFEARPPPDNDLSLLG